MRAMHGMGSGSIGEEGIAMRILQVGLSFNPGGVESFVMNYYRRLVKRGVQFDFVCMYEHLAYEDEIRRLGGKIFYLPNVKKNPVFFTKKFREILLAGEYEIVHVNMLSAANVLPLKTARQSGVKKVIAHSHNTRTVGFVRNVMHALNRKRIAEYANVYLACSKEAGSFLFGKWVQREKVQVISNAIEAEAYSFSEEARAQRRAELGIDGSTYVIFHAGRMESQKNHMFLLDIFEKVLNREPDSLLLLAGEGKLQEAIVQKAKQKQIEGRIMLLGVRNDVAELYSAADLFCFPSLFEGLSLTAVEAQANGLDCIFSDRIGGETIFAPNVIVNSLGDSPDKWAESICQMRSQSKRKEEQNDKRLQLVKKAGFDIEEQAYTLENLYRDC